LVKGLSNINFNMSTFIHIFQNSWFGLPFYALSIVLSLLNVELSLAFYIFIDLIYVLPIPFLRFGRPDMFSVGAQEAPEDDLPHTHAKHELPEVAGEPEGK
jgi:hypothetical protein